MRSLALGRRSGTKVAAATSEFRTRSGSHPATRTVKRSLQARTSTRPSRRHGRTEPASHVPTRCAQSWNLSSAPTTRRGGRSAICGIRSRHSPDNKDAGTKTRMPISSWPEIRNRATAFAREWRDTTSERAEAQTFWNEFFEIFGVKRRRVAVYEKQVDKLPAKGK